MAINNIPNINSEIIDVSSLMDVNSDAGLAGEICKSNGALASDWDKINEQGCRNK